VEAAEARTAAAVAPTVAVEGAAHIAEVARTKNRFESHRPA
jgi:hypothetical protein